MLYVQSYIMIHICSIMIALHALHALIILLKSFRIIINLSLYLLSRSIGDESVSKKEIWRFGESPVFLERRFLSHTKVTGETLLETGVSK